MGRIRDAVNGENGFYLGLKMTDDELELLRYLVEAQWRSKITSISPELTNLAESTPIRLYHQFSDCFSHATAWPKLNRILSSSDAKAVRGMSFMKKLEEEFGDFEISDEENVGWEEIYWRLVRPGQEGDVGPIHADEWFWTLGHGKTPPGVTRVKVWMAIYTEVEQNGLLVLPGSHLKQWRYHGEERHGFVKPVFDEDPNDLPMRMPPIRPGEMIVFNDRLLHGGSVNRGRETRVSAEFTIFSRN